MSNARVEFLHANYKVIIDSIDTNNKEQFCQAFAVGYEYLEMADSEMSERKLAGFLGISWPSVVRWRKGSAAPHPVVRKPTLKAILKRLKVYMEENK